MLLALIKPKDNKTQAFHHLRKRLSHHHREAVSRLHNTHSHLAGLAQKHGVKIHKLREHGHRVVATAVLSSSMLAAVPAADLAKQRVGTAEAASPTVNQTIERPIFPAIEEVAVPVPAKPVPEAITEIVGELRPNFEPTQEAALSKLFEEQYGVKAAAELEGKRLNVVYGAMGGEQHLKRFPGDSAGEHKNNIDTRPELSGVAPGLGAWGYFASSREAFKADSQIYEREKFYIAAQTFKAPGWEQNTREMYNWFRFRKVFVVNPKTGQACVAVIGDAGPGLSTKKNFGGSPEVMDAVGLSRGSRKGPVMVFFVDDPENKIPLGHVNPGDHKKK